MASVASACYFANGVENLLEFEKPIAALEKELQSLKEGPQAESAAGKARIADLEKRVAELIDETCAALTPWQRVQLSRHPNRPYASDYLELLFADFLELHGDRGYGDDAAVIAGVATWHGEPLAIVAQQKGRNTKQKMERNFGMARPEGYRKAMRVFEMAARFHMPVLTLIDTPGAYPGIDAEERGQSQAIAESIRLLCSIDVPVVSVVIGEGGSGGALALGVANCVLALEYSVYSVISPESCASILWSDSSLAERAADRLKIDPQHLKSLGVIDAIVPEPPGGAQRDWKRAAELLGRALDEHLKPLLEANAQASGKKPRGHRGYAAARRAKFRKMGERAIIASPRKESK